MNTSEQNISMTIDNGSLDNMLIVQAEPGISAPMGEHLMMLSIEHGAYFDLNPTAKLIWELLSTPRTLNDLCAFVSDEFDVSKQQCRESVENFILELQKEKMIFFKI